MKLRLDQLEPNRWNANEVTGDRYLLLVKDMREAGQREPVTVSPYPVFYPTEDKDPEHPYITPETWDGFFVICDGEHRYKAAVELGWAELEATVEDLTEDQAVTRFYRQQATRGGFDPLREARMFQHYLDEGLTQEQVVEKLGLSSDTYLRDRTALLKLSSLVQDLVANLKGMLEARVRERATNETEEELKEIIEEIRARARIDLRALRSISTLPENDQGLLLASLLDTFADGGTVSTRQVAQMVKEAKARSEDLKSFNAAWMAAATKSCPVCGRPPTLSGWDPAHRASNTFACAGGHSWRYDVTPEEARAQEQEDRRQRAEEAQRRAEEAVAARKTQDAKLIEDVLGDYAEPPTLDILMREFYQRSDIIDFGDVRKAVALYLQEHPDVKLPEPLTPQQLEAKKQQPEAEAPEAPEAEEPPHVDLAITAQEIHGRIMPWLLRKLGELTGIESISLTGFRGEEQIKIEYKEPDHKGRTTLNFSRETTEPGPVEGTRKVTGWDWFNFSITALKLKQGLRVTTEKSNLDMATICSFIENAPKVDADPWKIEKWIEAHAELKTPVEHEAEAAPDLDAGEEHHEHYEHDEEDLPVCPECGKQSPNSHYCTSCGKVFEKEAPEPEEDVAHVLTPNEELWGATATGKLGGLANALNLEEALWLREQETRRRALKHLDKRIAVLRLANAPTLTLEEGP